MNHINQQLKQEVCQWLGWTPEQYATMQYNSGIYYLVLFLRENRKAIDIMERSRAFWKWWIVQWQQRDMVYMQRAARVPAAAYDATHRVQDYYMEHDVTVLTHVVAIPRCIGYKVKEVSHVV